MGDQKEHERKIRLELLDGTIEASGSEEFVRRAQAVFMRLATSEPLPVGPPVYSGDAPPPGQPASERAVQFAQPGSVQPDIRSLKEEKQPRNVVEMAALVAYYVANLAPENERRETINAQDITKLFGQASYPTTTQPRNILFHAKNAGYLDSPSVGEYRINPVGYNLVTAGLPSDSAASPRRRRTAAKRSTAKKKNKK